MNKKLKFYCWLLFIVVAATLLHGRLGVKYHSSYAIYPDERLEIAPELEGISTITTDSVSGTTTSRYSQFFTFDVAVEPKLGMQDRQLLSHTPFKPIQDSQVVIQRAQLQVSGSSAVSKSTTWVWLWLIAGLCICAIYVWIIVLIYKVIRLVAGGNVFVALVARRIETLGKLLCCIFLADTLFSYVGYLFVSQIMALAQYNIVFENRGNVMFLIMGLVLIIIAQIILMGKELKEEQELTI